MTNGNIIQRGTLTTGLAVIIGKCSLDSQHGGSFGILRMLAVLISGKQTTNQVTTQFRDTNRKMDEREDSKRALYSYFSSYSNHSEYKKKNDRNLGGMR